MNGDGYDDVIIGAPNADELTGAAYVLFGGSQEIFESSFSVANLDGSNGFRFTGISEYSRVGWSVSGAGDINGNGYDDIIIGAPYAGQRVFVVYGAPVFPGSFSTTDLDGTKGFQLVGINQGDFTGNSVSSAGDVNGDGFHDIIIGARLSDPSGAEGAGESYVVYGGPIFPATVSLANLDGKNGFRLDGIDPDAFSGSSVSGAGDLNGDGFDDIIVGAPRANPSGIEHAGASYVVFGFRSHSPNYAGEPVPSQYGGTNKNLMADNFTPVVETSVVSMTWWGAYQGIDRREATLFRIYIYEHGTNKGDLGAKVLDVTINPLPEFTGQVTDNFQGIYRYHVQWLEPVVSLEAGKRYFLSMVEVDRSTDSEDNPNENEIWGWLPGYSHDDCIWRVVPWNSRKFKHDVRTDLAFQINGYSP